MTSRLLGVIGAVACCGLPILLGAGAAVTIAGPELRSWLLVLAGTHRPRLGLPAAGVQRGAPGAAGRASN